MGSSIDVVHLFARRVIEAQCASAADLPRGVLVQVRWGPQACQDGIARRCGFSDASAVDGCGTVPGKWASDWDECRQRSVKDDKIEHIHCMILLMKVVCKPRGRYYFVLHCDISYAAMHHVVKVGRDLLVLAEPWQFSRRNRGNMHSWVEERHRRV